MSILFITGLSGVGKSSALGEMEARGYRTIDLDIDYMTSIDGERLIDEVKLQHLINQKDNTPLILAGTESNQGKFYKQFEAVILLEADLETMLERVEKRINNPYGKTMEERNNIIEQYEWVLPLLRKKADRIIDTSQYTISEVSDIIESFLI